MRILVVILMVGVIMLIGGIILPFAAHVTVTWQPKSKILASEKPMGLSTREKSQNARLHLHRYDQYITTTVKGDKRYGYRTTFIERRIFRRAKNFVITGNARARTKFSFYVFNKFNFDLWKEGKAYTSYYETKGKTSFRFKFSIATKEAFPDTFYFVVKGYATVYVESRISWVEPYAHSAFSVMPVGLRYREYRLFGMYPIINTGKDFVLEGNASEVAGKKFNFYILDKDDYDNWYVGKPFTAYFERKNVTSTSFSVSLTERQANNDIWFLAENPLPGTNGTVKFSATSEWDEKPIIAATASGEVLGRIIAFLGFIMIIIAGVALRVLLYLNRRKLEQIKKLEKIEGQDRLDMVRAIRFTLHALARAQIQLGENQRLPF